MYLSDSLVNKTLRSYVSEVTPQICERIRLYIDLLLRWNQRVSLTTVTDPLQILSFHFGESFFARLALDIRSVSLIDIGSGAGFPGLALKILMDNLRVTLVESNSKKATFLSEVVRSLELSSAEVCRSRMEDFEPGEKVEFVTARALGNFNGFL